MLLFVASSFAQKTTTETLNVSGVCGMCKKKIEKAAKEAGASYAVWSTNTKVLTVRYSSLSTNLAKIQQKIADAGYDTPDFKATDDAYNKLDACCQYDRESAANDKGTKGEKSCCDQASNSKGKMDCCDKNSKGSKMDCCNKSTTDKTKQQ